MHEITGLLFFTVVAGCSPLKPVPLETGFTGLKPTSFVEVGHLYFTGGQQYGFTTAAGTKFYELCYEDFDLDNELQQIGSHVEEVGIDIVKHSSDPKFTLSGDTKIPLLPNASASSGRTYVVQNLRRFRLTGIGMDIVRDNIGDNCKREIVSQQTAGHSVVLVASAQRADSIIDTTKYSLSATIETPIGSIGPSVEDTAVTEYKLIYLSALMQAPPR